MCAIMAEHYNNEVTLKNSNRHISYIKIDVLMRSVHNTFHHAGMTGDMTLLSSDVLGLRL